MINHKIKWSIGLLLVVALIVATNFIDRNNYQRIQDSVASIYEDRLIAKDYLFDIQLEIHQKELLLAQGNDSLYITQQTASQEKISNLVDGFSKTKLTREEKRVFDDFEKEIASLFALETAYSTNAENLQGSTRLSSQIDKIDYNLHQLADIQITEGKRQMQVGKKAMESVDLLTQLEIWIVVIIAIIIQIVILYSPKPKED
ncbi:chemoreceptor-like protein with four helix bundle sensory module [Nonlabens dokdonensis]|uniref:Ribosomal protein L11 methyltransferase n=2 Tax=Nonlabens dokdonensis TaxID=328515 RepID=L7WF00_NONDD|nr:MCP four helix bundle domain-containing protein [Nonlabens dokdonensis]AGC78704.1 ribosomal protein L11 methyltransferase [Nonlabens dokdonensis DSW-6]PZX39169.1 chemoreceptor-like protein with four helix bundle sensory module [Nonlabens dokdonensis]